MPSDTVRAQRQLPQPHKLYAYPHMYAVGGFGTEDFLLLSEFGCKRPGPAHCRQQPQIHSVNLSPGGKTAMPRRNDLHTIMILGSGPIVIGQAAEFDYSG